MKTKPGRKLINTALIFAGALLGGCSYYPPINVKVIDAETEQPIEGAVLLAQWNKTHGVGLSATTKFIVEETVSDESGTVKMRGVTEKSIDPPWISVYKKGYVGWSNRVIFPGYQRRKGFKWRNGYIFKLEKYRPEYSRLEHVRFLGNLRTGDGEFGLYRKAWRWEVDLLYTNSL